MNKYSKFNSTLAEVKKSLALDLKYYTGLIIVNHKGWDFKTTVRNLISLFPYIRVPCIRQHCFFICQNQKSTKFNPLLISFKDYLKSNIL